MGDGHHGESVIFQFQTRAFIPTKRRKRGKEAKAMSRTFHHGKRGRERPIRVRGVRRDPPDLRGIARVLIALAQAADAETKAAAEHPRSESATEGKTARHRPDRGKQSGDEAA